MFCLILLSSLSFAQKELYCGLSSGMSKSSYYDCTYANDNRYVLKDSVAYTCIDGIFYRIDPSFNSNDKLYCLAFISLSPCNKENYNDCLKDQSDKLSIFLSNDLGYAFYDQWPEYTNISPYDTKFVSKWKSKQLIAAITVSCYVDSKIKDNKYFLVVSILDVNYNKSYTQIAKK